MMSRCPSGCGGRASSVRHVPGAVAAGSARSLLTQGRSVGRRGRWLGLAKGRKAAARVRAEEPRPRAERTAVGLAEAEAVWERRATDREDLVEALAAPDAAGAPAAGAHWAVSARLTVHREVFRHLVRERLRAVAAAQVRWGALRPIRVAGGFPRHGIHAPVPPVPIRGVRTLPLRAVGRVPRPRRRTVAALTRRLARRGRLGCTEAHHRDPGSRVSGNWTALTPEPGPVAMPRTPLGIAPHTSPGRILAFRSRDRFWIPAHGGFPARHPPI